MLVVGIGNLDRGDDGVGPAVARRLCGRLPASVKILERSGDALALLNDWERCSLAVVIDASSPMTEPGRIRRLDLTQNPLSLAFAPASSHAFGLAETIELARSLQRPPSCLVAYLVEGEKFAAGAPLSPMVVKAVEAVVERILAEIFSVSQNLERPCMKRHSSAISSTASRT
jgi:hydrogenase maturation protease